MEGAVSEFPPETTEHLDRFLDAVKAEGESLTRVRFFEILEENEPKKTNDYFEYDVLGDTFSLAADFSQVWDIKSCPRVPEVQLQGEVEGKKLPSDFVQIGGVSEWIQSEDIPICPACDSDMALFMQLKSMPNEFTKENKALRALVFGDAGNFYLFACTDCHEYKVLSQCY